jgi:hypothetical protein
MLISELIEQLMDAGEDIGDVELCDVEGNLVNVSLERSSCKVFDDESGKDVDVACLTLEIL